MDEVRDLCRISGAVRVEHHQDVTGRSIESGAERGSLAATLLHDHTDVGDQRPRDLNRPIGGTAVYENNLVHEVRDSGQDVAEISLFIEGWNNDRNRGSGHTALS